MPGVARHVKNLTMPFTPDHNTPKELTGGFGEHADYMRMRVIKKERRLAFARFGEKSGVRAVDAFPSMAEQEDEIEKEKHMWPDYKFNNVSSAKV